MFSREAKKSFLILVGGKVKGVRGDSDLRGFSGSSVKIASGS
jgi:hypothetical protein